MMTKYGWREGQSLGSSVLGIVDALDAEGGQKPSDKRGFGYEMSFFVDVLILFILTAHMLVFLAVYLHIRKM